MSGFGQNNQNCLNKQSSYGRKKITVNGYQVLPEPDGSKKTSFWLAHIFHHLVGKCEYLKMSPKLLLFD